jgi:hypothetical protein
MTISGFLPVFLCACFGGALAELLKWFQLRDSPNLPAYARSPLYWAVTAAMVLAGGVLATLYGTEPRSAILVLHIGLSAPLIIKTLAETRAGPASPAPPPGGPRGSRRPGYSMARAGGGPSVLNFVAGR